MIVFRSRVVFVKGNVPMCGLFFGAGGVDPRPFLRMKPWSLAKKVLVINAGVSLGGGDRERRDSNPQKTPAPHHPSLAASTLASSILFFSFPACMCM